MGFRVWAALMAALVLGFGNVAGAQDRVWIQIEAHPTEPEATQRARDLATQLTPLEGYQLSSGWFALAIGPLAAPDAQIALRQLRATRQIPADSYLVDGRAYGPQFWPPIATLSQVETSPLADLNATDTPAPSVGPANETQAQARRSENLLSREEKQELQSALAWEGFYNSAIDGALGRGSRRAMGAWQAANGYEVTGVLTTNQRRALIEGYRGLLASVGLVRHFDDVAGIDVDIPGAMVAFDRYEPPFVHFAATSEDEVQVLLISQSGDRASLGALYDVLQSAQLVPLDGPRSLNRNDFVIEGANDSTRTYVEARLVEDGIKGFMLVWPAGADKRRDLVLARMTSSFAARAGVVMPDTYGDRGAASADLVSGLEIRRATATQSGFYVSSDGAVVTAAGAAQSCDRITLDNDVVADVTFLDGELGIAVLAPRQALMPARFASLATLSPRVGSEVAVSGYSFDGRLGAPSLTFGTLAGLSGLAQEPDLRQVAMRVTESDVGGPLLAASGAVLGMLLPRDTGARVLPQDANFVVAPDALRKALVANGITPVSTQATQSMAPEDLGKLAADMTVLVNCWN